MITRFLTAILVVVCGGLEVAAASGDGEEYIQVEVHGILETGISAIGGETTGTTIKVKNVVWELDLGGKKELEELAKKLDKKPAIVSGRYYKKKGVEIPERHIVIVATLKAAGK